MCGRATLTRSDAGQYIALFLLLREGHSIGHAIGWWFILVLLYQIVLGCLMGALVGVIARKLLKFSKRRELIDRESMVRSRFATLSPATEVDSLSSYRLPCTLRSRYS